MANPKPPAAKRASTPKARSILETDVPLAQAITEIRGSVTAISEDVKSLKAKDQAMESSIASVAEKFATAMAEQGEKFTASIEKVTETFIRRDEFSLYRKAIQGAAVALLLYGWECLQKSHGITP